MLSKHPQGVNKTPHTAVHRGKRVKVVLANGEQFIDKFWSRTGKYVFFQKRGKVIRGQIKSFTIWKGPNL